MNGSPEASTSTAPAAVTAKRVKLSHKLNYRNGLFLAPMVRQIESNIIHGGAVRYSE